MYKIFILISFAININLNAQIIEMSDVSVLFPLTNIESWNLLPTPDFETKLGALLPAALVIEKIPTLLQFTANKELYTQLRAVGFRIDPCFQEGSTPLKCRTLIRFIWQPLKIVNNETSTVDVALHSFYDIEASEFADLIKDIKKLKLEFSVSQLENQPLLVHPILKNQGLSGAYYSQLMPIIFKYIGQQNLSRITFMQLFANETVWFFGGIDINGNDVKKIIIPRINQPIQQFVNQATQAPPTQFFGRIFPAPQESENLNILLTDSVKLTSANEAELIAASRAAFRFENPKLHNPGTVDCVSCHAAQPAKSWALKTFPKLNLDLINAADIYVSKQNITNTSPLQENTNIVRIFGYFNNQPFIAQRAINESAEVVDYINQFYQNK